MVLEKEREKKKKKKKKSRGGGGGGNKHPNGHPSRPSVSATSVSRTAVTAIRSGDTDPSQGHPF